jgi:hypothetical protein
LCRVVLSSFRGTRRMTGRGHMSRMRTGPQLQGQQKRTTTSSSPARQQHAEY